MWTRPDRRGIIALLVIFGKPPSSGLLHNLWFISMCSPLERQCLQYLRRILYSTGALSSSRQHSHKCHHQPTIVEDTASSHCAGASQSIHNIYALYLHGKIMTWTRTVLERLVTLRGQGCVGKSQNQQHTLPVLVRRTPTFLRIQACLRGRSRTRSKRGGDENALPCVFHPRAT